MMDTVMDSTNLAYTDTRSEQVPPTRFSGITGSYIWHTVNVLKLRIGKS